ncbi:MAG TPA: isocitrate lyase/phosphoenolpyruvate mutase family protein [Gaiellaceae bacterium]|nr:isocitrate lyase/phosphoenolpyruvate mutase family protein [Gaiellaceae bacterium]
MTQHERADLFRRMHLEPPLLVLPNAWDVASARVLAPLPGCRALATSSAAVARSLGWEDGEQAPVEEMVRVAGRIAAAVDVPVTADLEAGYGDPVGTAGAAWEAGVVGMNFEDSSGGRLETIERQVERIAAIREAVPALVLNARVDVFVHGSRDVGEAIERGNAYLRAGADCVYPILCPTAAIAELAGGIDGPLNVLAGRDVPGPDELHTLGVARLTWGGGLAAAAYAEAARVVQAALSDG